MYPKESSLRYCLAFSLFLVYKQICFRAWVIIFYKTFTSNYMYQKYFSKDNSLPSSILDRNKIYTSANKMFGLN